jgi:hypothetical protein
VLEQQGLLVVVRADGDMSLFLRPARDEDWVLPPMQLQQRQQQRQQQQQQAPAGNMDDAASAAGAANGNGGYTSSSNGGSSSAAAGDMQQEQQPAQQQVQHQHQYGLTAIRPRKVTLRSHRTQLACAAACAAGVATASSLGAIKLWSADALAKEAERGGLLLKQLQLSQQATALLSSSMGSSMDYSRSVEGCEGGPGVTGGLRSAVASAPHHTICQIVL